MAHREYRESFAEWLKRVDGFLLYRHGLCHEDLPEVPWSQWYDEKKTAIDAVNAMVQLVG